MRKLRIGLLVDDVSSSKYVYELANWAQQQNILEISHLIISSPKKKGFFEKSKELLDITVLHRRIAASIFNLIVSIEKKLLNFSKLHRTHFDRFDLREVVSRKITIQPSQARDDGSYGFSELDVKRVSALELDLIVRHGHCQIAGEILRAARLGTVAYSNVTDPEHGRDTSCFWECYTKASKTGFAIETLTDGVHARKTLLSGFFPTNFCFSLNQAVMYRKSSPHFHELLKRIAASGELPNSSPEVRSKASPNRAPNVGESITYLLKLSYRLSKRLLYRSINFQKKWGLSFIESSWRGLHSHRRYQAIAPRGHFWADPFVYSHGGKTYCFIEDYVYKTGLGHIAVLEVSRDSAIHLGDCIKEPFHLSFPFLFEHEGTLYMCPEASASRKIQLYRCVDFPLRWEPSTTIMEDVSAADSMLFEHAGMWWMLTSIDKSGSDDYTSELYLFYADSPHSKSWASHPANPIYIDSEGGRNAGLILEDGKIFRLAQRQGFDQYGKGLMMFEVTQLTKSKYAERQLPRISPPLSNGQIGTHHLSTTGTVTVFDHVSRSFAQ
jgi:hypothetical protein